MDATQVAHEHTVDIDPHVVIAGKVIGHLATAFGLGSRVATILLYKAGGHVETEVVVDLGIVRLYAVLSKATLPLNKHVIAGIKREKLPVRRAAGRINAPGFIQRKRLGLLIELGEVLLAVVIVVAVIVNLQEAVDIHIGRLAIRGGIAKKVGEGLVSKLFD